MNTFSKNEYYIIIVMKAWNFVERKRNGKVIVDMTDEMMMRDDEGTIEDLREKII